ncbi:MAG: cytochrome b/b6 domain-containing protein [Rhodoferax sp.]|uniref:cytochrome b/b6 domain-containing protein n=1 Tax=Rhodoferax sp. TaxID=50421 RepID=UPI003264B453
MNTEPAAPDKPRTYRPNVKVWDVPVRVAHWLLALSFAGAYLTSEGESWRLVHITLGYTVGGLLVFRVFWGLVGTRYARFANFLRGPTAIAAYAKSMLRGRPLHSTGHNPAGAVAIVVMILLGLSQLATGWAVYNDIGGEWIEEMHELGGNAMLAVVIAHIAGVVVASVLHRANLARAMVTGDKPGEPQEAITRTWSFLGACVLAVVLGFWAYQWWQAPVVNAYDTGDAQPVTAIASKST